MEISCKVSGKVSNVTNKRKLKSVAVKIPNYNGFDGLSAILIPFLSNQDYVVS